MDKARIASMIAILSLVTTYAGALFSIPKETMESPEYAAAKDELRLKYARNEAMSWEEYQAFVVIVDAEAKVKKPVLKNISTERDLREQVANYLAE